MTVSGQDDVPGSWKRTENDQPLFSGPKKVARIHRQIFGKFDGPGNEKSQTSILGENFRDGWRN